MSGPVLYVLYGICLLRVLVRQEMDHSKKYNGYKRSVARTYATFTVGGITRQAKS